jgi:dihydrofolate synthase/folylpolyglutamate synthase
MHFTQLDQWLSWLQTRKTKRFFAADALLDVRIVAEKLNLLQCTKPVITVSGTNGKGSCVALLNAIYSEADYQIGTFTSPHLLRFNERICINQQAVSDELICEAFQKIDRVCGDIILGYFQFSFLAALLIFHQFDLDLLVLEVGIGGLYDAVNLIDPDLAVISSIDYDHCEILGHTRELIALQKAGIMRRHIPVICGDLDPPRAIEQEAEKVGALLYQQNKDFCYQIQQDGWCWQYETMRLCELPQPKIYLQDASTVLMAVNRFQSTLPVQRDEIMCGLQNVYLSGRCELVYFQGIRVMLDVAHNPAASKHLFQIIQSLTNVNRKYVVFGMLQDKDIMGTLKVFEYCGIDRWFLATLAGDRGTDAKYLADLLEQIGIKNFSCYNAPSLAFLAARQQAVSDDLIIVFGSFRTVSDVIQHVLYSEVFNGCKIETTVSHRRDCCHTGGNLFTHVLW